MKCLKAQFFTFVTILVMQLSSASAESLKQDNIHIRTWNNFATNILKLHESLIAEQPIHKTTQLGGYAGRKEFYVEEQYFLKDNLISIIQWEKNNPETMHAIELFIYDDKNRVIRDYTAAYLPDYRNAPTQTLISLHQYRNGLHAFRTFDASGYRIIERCNGTQKGKLIDMMLDEDEIAEAIGDDTGAMTTADYLACFKGLPVDAGKYLTPQ
jgi:hypothetical protein